MSIKDKCISPKELVLLKFILLLNIKDSFKLASSNFASQIIESILGFIKIPIKLG
jgi:hypothetical protein